MHHKPFGGCSLLGPAGGAYSAPPDPLAGLRGWDPPWRGRGRERGGEGGERVGLEPNLYSRFGGKGAHGVAGTFRQLGK